MPKEWLPFVPVGALAISILALLVSAANVGWSIYKELALRGRLRVMFGLKRIHQANLPEPLTRLVFSVVNHGPGKLKITMFHLKAAPMWRRLLRRTRRAALMHEYDHPYGGKLPLTIDVGEGADFTWSPDTQFLREYWTHVGIIDSFGRVHWCRAKELREAKRDAKNLDPA